MYCFQHGEYSGITCPHCQQADLLKKQNELIKQQLDNSRSFQHYQLLDSLKDLPSTPINSRSYHSPSFDLFQAFLEFFLRITQVVIAIASVYYLYYFLHYIIQIF